MVDFLLWLTFELMVDFSIMGEGGQRDKETNTHAHQYHDSAWPKGRAE